ncbi:MAG: hypothetical protein JXQ65_10615 [Candidatus Marinimicrobia bacterium]|nr:hypothetical protein [Candidatus Neomarinimicrobiota bacterium]
MKLKQLKIILLFILTVLLIWNCSKKEIAHNLDFEEKILVKIGNRTISVSEYIKRAEYTPRPTYCNNNFPVDKKIILNSLVAEKLLAMEAGLDSAEILKNEYVHDYLKGIREQAMRQILQYEEGHQKVTEIDTVMVHKMAANMNIEYDISYINLSSKDTAEMISKRARDVGLQTAVREFFPDTLARRFVKWHEYENDKVLHALFSQKHKPNEVISPLEINKSSFLLIEVNNWKGNVAQNRDEQIRTFGRAVDYKTNQKADAYYTDYVQGMMKDKTLEFDEEMFYKILNVVAPIYLQTAQKKSLLQNLFFDNQEREVRLNNRFNQLQELMDKAFYSFDGKTWTVREFLKYRRSHPLVFRNKEISKESFPEDFKLAVIDMMTDYVLTEESYKRGFDKVNIVKRHYEMWKDNVVAESFKFQYLKDNNLDSLYFKDQDKAFQDYLNPYVTELQKKYSDQIFFNGETFLKIKLNRIPMSVYKPLAPFPMVVPGFPVITTKDDLDYGKLMK